MRIFKSPRGQAMPGPARPMTGSPAFFLRPPDLLRGPFFCPG